MNIVEEEIQRFQFGTWPYVTSWEKAQMALMVEGLLCLVTILSNFDILGGTHKWVNIFIAAMNDQRFQWRIQE